MDKYNSYFHHTTQLSDFFLTCILPNNQQSTTIESIINPFNDAFTISNLRLSHWRLQFNLARGSSPSHNKQTTPKTLFTNFLKTLRYFGFILS